MMEKLLALLQSLRPPQWTKNGFILLPMVFARRLGDLPSVLFVLQAVTIFILLSGAVYIINDLTDIEADRRHPSKRDRPLASGRLTKGEALAALGVLLPVSLLWGLWCGTGFFLTLLAYFVLQLLYTLWLKEKVIVDILCISAGFLLRVIGGAVIIDVLVSHWLVLCTVLVSTLLALGKRRHELSSLGEEGARSHRKVLSSYNIYLLDQMIGVITAGVLVTYMLYCVSPETIEKFHTDQLLYTLPFVVYGIFRYLYLIHVENQGGSPERMLLSDLPLLLSVLLWGVCCIVILYGEAFFGASG